VVKVSDLDINTPLGQLTLAEEQAAKEIFERNMAGWRYIETDKTNKATVDAILEKNGFVRGVVETKCRQMVLERFSTTFGSKWLVTAAKIERCKHIAEDFNVPFYGFLYLVLSRKLLIKRLWQPNYGWLVKIRREETATRATVNGGMAMRVNAFIDMSSAILVR